MCYATYHEELEATGTVRLDGRFFELALNGRMPPHTLIKSFSQWRTPERTLDDVIREDFPRDES